MEEEPLAAVRARLPRRRLRPVWIETRRSGLLFEVARRHEAAGEFRAALALYRKSLHPEARLRTVRILEMQQRLGAAHAAARAALRRPRAAAEAQCLPRTLRRLGLPACVREPLARSEHLELALPAPKAK